MKKIQNNLPTTFMLAGKRFNIAYVKTKASVSSDADLGRCKGPLCQIDVETHWLDELIPEISQEQTLYHEVIHCVLEELGRLDLSNDEVFVQSFSTLLHQVVKTLE